MKIGREEKKGLRLQFVLLRFVQEEGDSVLTDKVIKETQLQHKLRPVTQREFFDYWREILHRGKPEVRIAAFGNFMRGDPESGGFVGIPFFDTSGCIKLAENWARGQNGDDWAGDWMFLFTPLL